MEIIHLVLGKANPNRMNGVNTAVNSLANEQSKLGYNVCLWGISNNIVHDYPGRTYNTVLYENKKWAAATLYNICRGINKIKGQTVVHIHGGFIPIFFTIGYLLKRNKVPFIYTTHGAYNKIAIERSGLKKKLYFNLFENRLIKWAAALHFVGKSETEMLHISTTSAKSSLIPNGLAVSTQSLNFINNQNNQELVFGFCGRISIIEKGLDILLKAFADYKNVYKKSGTLCLIGDGKEMADLQQMAIDLNVAQHVTFLGSIYGDEKMNAIKNFSVFVHPSRNEGMPTSVLEAASLGVPSIVSTETNMGKYIADYEAGYVLKSNTSKHLLDAFLLVEKQVFTKQWVQQQLNCKKMVKTEFQWDKIAGEHIKMYQQVLNI